MRKLATYVFCLFLVFMPMTSCIGPQVSPQAGATLIAEIDAQERDGLLTPAKALALREAVEEMMSEGGVDWETLLYTVGGAALTAITGVRISRGPAKPMDKSQAQELKDMLAERRAAKAKEDEGAEGAEA